MINSDYNLSLVSFIYDLISFFSIIIVLIYLHKRKIITANTLILLSCFCMTPFIFNNVLFSHSTFPDQTRYLQLVSEFRQGIFFLDGNNTLTELKNIWFSSLILAFFPIVSFSSINAIAFANKFMIVFLFIFFQKKKIPNIFLFSLIFFPSLIIYSSLSLRDVLVLFIMIMAAYNFLEKKYFTFIILLGALFLIKEQNSFFTLGALLVYKILSKDFIGRRSIKLILIFTIFWIFSFEIFEILNNYRLGFYLETRGYQDMISTIFFEKYELYFDLNGIGQILLGFFKTYLYPISYDLDFFRSFLFLDNIIFSLVFLLNCIHVFSHKKYEAVYWLTVYIVINIILSIIVFNEMTLLRYKMNWVVFCIFCLNYVPRENNIDKKKL